MEDTATYGECVECGIEHALDINGLCSICGTPTNNKTNKTIPNPNLQLNFKFNLAFAKLIRILNQIKSYN